MRPTKKPDLDNVIKSILDALNKVAYHDDTQIVSLSMEKFYSDSPRVEVTINSI
ncbi:RusA family crossover junction endodeoxyribonuclease [Anaerobutyricum hallii]|uniref:RusA family crossover junction endodeoxyribonuclease n=1 Tax=Anaerobutyricum hallii TaxID=39488 RepID=UPI002FE6F170